MTALQAFQNSARPTAAKPLTAAWFSFFPVEWLPDVPDYVREMPRGHPATWQRVLLAELGKNGLHAPHSRSAERV